MLGRITRSLIRFYLISGKLFKYIGDPSEFLAKYKQEKKARRLVKGGLSHIGGAKNEGMIHRDLAINWSVSQLKMSSFRQPI